MAEEYGFKDVVTTFDIHAWNHTYACFECWREKALTTELIQSVAYGLSMNPPY